MRSSLVVVLLTACGSAPKPATKAPPPATDATGNPDPSPEEEAHTAGILGSTQLEQGGAFASLTGTGDISSGFDDANIYGGLLGNDGDSWWDDDEVGELNGGFGYGRSGAGPGGTGWGTIGTGRYGQIGHGSGTGSGYGVGTGRGGMRGRTTAVPVTRLGSFTTVGDLDKAIIRRYVKRNIHKISYCYEKELLAKPSLAGSVAVSFTIGNATGTVTVQKDTPSMKDLAPVSQCVAAVIGSILFPKPKGTQDVKVDFPFTFAPSGATP